MTKKTILIQSLLIAILGMVGLYLLRTPQNEGEITLSSSGAANSALAFERLRTELETAPNRVEPTRVESWKARAELIALDTQRMPLKTLLEIYQKLLSMDFDSPSLKGRLEGAIRRLTSLGTTSSWIDASRDLEHLIQVISDTESGLTREELLGELEAFEIYFYRLYGSNPKGSVEALFFAGLASHYRYFQGYAYIERYLRQCNNRGANCQNVKRAQSLISSHSEFLDMFVNE